MIDVEPMIVEQLEELVPSPGAMTADWRDVERRARVVRHPSRRLVLATAVLVGVVFAAVALARSFGSFSGWLTGEPGKPASAAQQRAFNRATRSWEGFPGGTELRQLAQTSVGGATYTLYGFRGAGSLCLRLVVTGNQSSHELACPPLSQLRSSFEPVLVVVADYGVGVGKKPASATAPLPIASIRPPEALVTLGIVADGVDHVQVAHRDSGTSNAVVSGDAFLSVDYAPSSGSRLTNVWAGAGGKRVAVPFTLPSALFSWPTATRPHLLAHGPATVQRVVHGGAILWLAHREPVGIPVPKTVHHIVGVLPSVIFAREITPDPSAPERMVVSVRPAGNVYSGGHLLNKLQVCAEVVGGRYVGGGGCWPAGRLFSTAPFSWGVAGDGSNQYVTIAGLASDDVARLRLYLGTGQQETVPLHDNGYIVNAPSPAFPLRLVGYDSHGLVIGVITLRGATGRPAGTPTPAQPVANARWRRVLKNSAGEVFVAPSTTGGTCVAIHESGGGGSIGCPRALPADGLDVGLALSRKGADTVEVRAGTAIKTIVIHYRNGHSQTVEPAAGVALATIPAAAKTSSFFDGIVVLTGLDGNGHVVASKNVLALVGGSGAIRKLTPSSISIGAAVCKITTASPALTGYQVGVHVQYLCHGGVLTLIGRAAGGHSWASRTVLTRGPIVALTATSITIKNTDVGTPSSPAPNRTCALTATSPSLHHYRNDEQVQAFCANGNLTGINKAPSG